MTTLTQVLLYIEDNMPKESATAYGLHPNAEIGFQCREANYLGSSLLCLEPQRATQDNAMSIEEHAKMILDDILEKLPETPKLDDIRSQIDEPTPFAMVALQVRMIVSTVLGDSQVFGAFIITQCGVVVRLLYA